MKDITPVGEREIRKAGMTGIGGVAGGIGIMILNGFAHGIWGLVVGGLVAGAGFLLTKGKDSSDKTTGFLIMGAGALAAISFIPILGGLAKFALGISGIGLLAMGVFNMVRFYKGMKSRS